MGKVTRLRPRGKGVELWRKYNRLNSFSRNQGCASGRAVAAKDGWLFQAQDLAADVGPELFCNVVERGGFDLGSPVLQRLIESALLRRVIGGR